MNPAREEAALCVEDLVAIAGSTRVAVGILERLCSQCDREIPIHVRDLNRARELKLAAEIRLRVRDLNRARELKLAAEIRLRELRGEERP